MIFFGIGSFVIAAVLAALYYGYRMAFYYQDPHDGPRTLHMDDQIAKVEDRLNAVITDMENAPYEAVSILSGDGLKLTARYYHAADGAPVQIQCHGYKGNSIRDFAGVWHIAREMGHNVLLIDQRCHGDSEGHTITFGVLEQKDCLAWVQYVCQRFGPVPILLMGVSMGAATVLMASGMDLPENVKGIVADCPYDSPSNIIKKVLGTEMGMPVKLIYPLIRLGGILYGKFDLESCSPIEAVTRSTTPILLIHGDDDRFVPYAMSCNLSKAAPAIIEFHTIAGAGHALNQVTAPGQYRDALLYFIQKYMK